MKVRQLESNSGCKFLAAGLRRIERRFGGWLVECLVDGWKKMRLDGWKKIWSMVGRRSGG